MKNSLLVAFAFSMISTFANANPDASQIYLMQVELNKYGFSIGEPDGRLGPATKKGIAAFARRYGISENSEDVIKFMQSLSTAVNIPAEKNRLRFNLQEGKQSAITDFSNNSETVSQEKMLQPEPSPPPSMRALNFLEKEAVARGQLLYFVDQLNPADPKTVEILRIVLGGIRAQNLAVIQDVSPDLASVLSIYTRNRVAFSDYKNFAEEVLEGAIEVALSTSRLAIAQTEIASEQTVVVINSDTSIIAGDVYRSAFKVEELGVYVKNIISEVESIRNEVYSMADENVRAAMLRRADLIEDSLIKGAVGNVLRDFTTKMVGQVRAFFASGNVKYLDGLSSSTKVNFFILEQAFTTFEQRAKIDKLMSEYASGPAKFIDSVETTFP